MLRLLLALALALLPGVALAAPTLSFDNPTLDGGTVAYNGAGGPFVADDVIFQQVIGVGTPQNAGVSLFCYPVNCLLDLATGPNLTEGPPVYTFAGGGSLSLIGGLNTAPDGSGAQIVPAGTLLAHDGVFGTPSVVLTGAVDSLLFIGAGSDTKDAGLAEFYGLPTDPWIFANTELALDTATFDPITGGFSATVTDADFANAAVPEPATLLLLGTGLLGMGWWRRRSSS